MRPCLASSGWGLLHTSPISSFSHTQVEQDIPALGTTTRLGTHTNVICAHFKTQWLPCRSLSYYHWFQAFADIPVPTDACPNLNLRFIPTDQAISPAHFLSPTDPGDFENLDRLLIQAEGQALFNLGMTHFLALSCQMLELPWAIGGYRLILLGLLGTATFSLFRTHSQFGIPCTPKLSSSCRPDYEPLGPGGRTFRARGRLPTIGWARTTLLHPSRH